MNFLLIYDRSKQLLVEEKTFLSYSEALQARFAAESRYAGHEVEVVVVGANSREALIETHGRYFLSAQQLTQRAEHALD
jgi:hypothetical protein